MHSISSKIVDAIILDLTDRRGLRQEWYNIDSDTQQEIRSEWERIVDKKLAQKTRGEVPVMIDRGEP